METWKKNLYVLWGTQFLAMVGMNLVVPFLPFFIRQLGVTDPDELARWSGLVFSGPFFVSFIATPIWGSLGDRYGRKLMVVRAIFGLGVSQALIGLSQNPLHLLLFRMLQGAISGFIAAALTLVSTSTPKERMGYALGVLQSASAAGVMLGPALGGLLADLMGYREIFYVTASLCFAGGFVIMKFVKETPQQSEVTREGSVLQNVRLMLTDRQLRVIGIAILLSQASDLMIEPIFALFVESFRSQTRYISTVAGVLFSVAGVFMVVSAPWWGSRNDRTGFKKNTSYALVGAGAAYALHMLVPSLFLLGVLRALLGFARGGILHSLYSMTSLRSPAERRSGLMGIASSFSVLGNMAGPLAGGMIAGHFGIASVFAVNSLLLIGTGVLLWRYYTESGRA